MKHGSRLVLEAGAGVGEAIGLDLSDTSGTYVVVNAQGEVSGEGKLALSPTGLSKIFARRKPTRIAIEAGTHSPWVSRLLSELGHEVIVANPRQVKLISQSYSKSDREDAELRGRLARLDPHLLRPIQHRGPEAQADLALLRSRDCVVRTRTNLINHVRGAVKSMGGRVPDCSTDSFAKQAASHIPALLRAALLPLLKTIEEPTRQIKAHDKGGGRRGAQARRAAAQALAGWPGLRAPTG